MFRLIAWWGRIRTGYAQCRKTAKFGSMVHTEPARGRNRQEQKEHGLHLRSSWKGYSKMNNLEIWKDIEGFDGAFQISSLGNVRSVDRYVSWFNGYALCKRFQKGGPVKQRINKRGYYVVSLKNKKSLLVSRLVALAFIPNDEEKPLINHIDGNKLNNKIENLEWVTEEENRLHAKIHGLIASGERSGTAKLTNEKIRAIRQEYKSKTYGKGYRALARKYGVNRCTIRSIVLGISWRNVV